MVSAGAARLRRRAVPDAGKLHRKRPAKPILPSCYKHKGWSDQWAVVVTTGVIGVGVVITVVAPLPWIADFRTKPLVA
jgi:hypothetical protein